MLAQYGNQIYIEVYENGELTDTVVFISARYKIKTLPGKNKKIYIKEGSPVNITTKKIFQLTSQSSNCGSFKLQTKVPTIKGTAKKVSFMNPQFSSKKSPRYLFSRSLNNRCIGLSC